MFTVCHTEEAELLPPQLLPHCPVYDTILIWFLILFPVLSNWPGGHRLALFSEILPCGVRESKFEERVPSGDLLFHVPYPLRRTLNVYVNFFLGNKPRGALPLWHFFVMVLVKGAERRGQWITGAQKDLTLRWLRIY